MSNSGNIKSAVTQQELDALEREFRARLASGREIAVCQEHAAILPVLGRRLDAQYHELLEQRLRRAGGSVYRRRGSRFWQIRYRDGQGRWHQESTHKTARAEARYVLAIRTFESRAGITPGNQPVEAAIDLLLADARARGLKSPARIERACRALNTALAGHRLKDVGRALLLDYLNRRRAACAADTVHLELSILRRAFRLARNEGWIPAVPEFPAVKGLRVREGFFEPEQWAQAREHMQSDLRDAADFAYYTGWREMEVLGLRWSDYDQGAQIVRLEHGSTKTGAGRSFPLAEFDELRRLLARRAEIKDRLRRRAIISPYIFCFEAELKAGARLYHAAGAPLFKQGANGRTLLSSLQAQFRAACAAAGFPGRMFHDLRRSAARNFERAGIPRSVARKLGGWKSDRIYSRYEIGAESELAGAGARIGAYLASRRIDASIDTRAKNSKKSKAYMAEKGRSRTFRRAQCPPGRF